MEKEGKSKESREEESIGQKIEDGACNEAGQGGGEAECWDDSSGS